MDIWAILSDVVILLAASLLLGGVFARFGLSPLVGYLVAGMVLGGPGSFGVVHSGHEIDVIAELGVALLLFSLGLEFSLERLRRLGVKPLAGGIAQVVLTTALGAVGAWLFGSTVKTSIAFGAMISLSSTAVVLRSLSERAELETPYGRNSLVVLLTQDMAVVPLALLMTLLAGDGGPAETFARIGELLFMAAALVLGLFVLNKIAVWALGTLTLLRNRELTILFAVATGLGSTWAAHAAGLSPALGAFIAGMLLGSSPFATQIRADVSSLRVVLLTLFFGAAGMLADPAWILDNWSLVAGITVLLTIGKLLVIWAVFRALGYASRTAAATGLCLAQIGEFAFVLGAVGRSSGVVPDEMNALVVSATIVSFILSALLVPLAPRFGAIVASLSRSGQAAPGDQPSSEHPPDVVVIGFGPAGQIAAQPFIDGDKRVVVVDMNLEGARRAREFGFQGEVGDATQTDVLEHAHVSQANAIVIAIPHYQAAMSILHHVRQLAPHAHIVVRSRYHIHADGFISAGAHRVVGDEEEVGEGMARHLRQWLDADARRAEQPTNEKSSPSPANEESTSDEE